MEKGELKAVRNGAMLVTWFKLPFYIDSRHKARSQNFDGCEFDNCILSFDRSTIEKADAVLFKGRSLPKKLPFTRPQGQVWIFAEDEAPITYDYDGGQWKSSQYRGSFNWTMSYDKTNADIFLPYGELRKRERSIDRDFNSIVKSKSKHALIITSHCCTQSQRMDYIKVLQKYISVDILGACGTRWNCGKLWVHDDCFKIMNTTYRYYLAFENAFCKWYKTEKIFDNFKYDILFVTRGDDASFLEENGNLTKAFISTTQFPNISALGKYLQSLSSSDERYAQLLRKKNEYFSVPYEQIYKRALCDICERMHFVELYSKTIPDIREWSGLKGACFDPTDLK